MSGWVGESGLAGSLANQRHQSGRAQVPAAGTSCRSRTCVCAVCVSHLRPRPALASAATAANGVVGSVSAGGAAALCALTLALDVACGMFHIHSKNIVHGDLSSANILLTTIKVCGGVGNCGSFMGRGASGV